MRENNKHFWHILGWPFNCLTWPTPHSACFFENFFCLIESKFKLQFLLKRTLVINIINSNSSNPESSSYISNNPFSPENQPYISKKRFNPINQEESSSYVKYPFTQDTKGYIFNIPAISKFIDRYNFYIFFLLSHFRFSKVFFLLKMCTFLLCAKYA